MHKYDYIQKTIVRVEFTVAVTYYTLDNVKIAQNNYNSHITFTKIEELVSSLQ